jgi:hypothetical protein
MKIVPTFVASSEGTCFLFFELVAVCELVVVYLINVFISLTINKPKTIHFMKKSFKLLFAALMTLAMIVPAQANDQLTIYNGVGSSSYVPFRNIDFQDNGMHSQLIYPANALTEMVGQQINSVTFYLTSGLMADGGQLVVKMGETETATYASASDFRTDLVQVAAMALTPDVTELVIEFSNPYNYQGGNLVLDFTNPVVGGDNWYGWNSWSGETQGSNYTAIGSNGAMATFLPKATFDYGVPQEWDARINPLGLDFNIPAEREEVQTITILNKGLNAFTPVLSSVAAPLSIDYEPVELAMGESVEIPVKFAPDQECTGFAKLTINCGEAGTFELMINFVATAPVYEVTVCESTSSYYGYVPFNGAYCDEVGTYGQMIYPAEMLTGLNGNKITSLRFYHHRTTLPAKIAGAKIRLSFKEVEQTEFATATPIADMTVVGHAVLAEGDTELLIVLDEPYDYNGGNLAVETYVEEKSGWNNINFDGVNFDYSPSMYHYSSNTRTSNFLPMATFAYDKGQAPQPEFEIGDVNHSGGIDIDDVTMLINKVLGNTAEGFFPENANCDGDEEGMIDIDDVTALITRVLTGAW